MFLQHSGHFLVSEIHNRYKIVDVYVLVDVKGSLYAPHQNRLIYDR